MKIIKQFEPQIHKKQEYNKNKSQQKAHNGTKNEKHEEEIKENTKQEETTYPGNCSKEGCKCNKKKKT